MTGGAITQGEGRAAGHSKKRGAPKRNAAPISATISTESVQADSVENKHLSSSPDLRITSSVQPSQVSPMTGFRLAQQPPRIQWRYRPGIAPGSLFSPGAVTAPMGTQMVIWLLLG